MGDLQIVKTETLGHHFIDDPFLPPGADEHYLRNEQSPRPLDSWRKLRPDEIERLVQNANASDDWNNILVTEEFDPRLITNCKFHGLVRIGRLDDLCLSHHELTVPVGITNSRIISCDIGDDVAIHNVRYLAHYIIGDNAMLLNIDEMLTTNHAKFGNGIVKEGEDEEVRVTLDLINEAGGRSVMPFDGMIAADAALWATHPHDTELTQRLGEITQKQFDARRGFYGTVGDRCVVKSCRIIKDVKIGPCAYVKGANKLKNLTINSTEEAPTQIGEGVELVNGITGTGCHIFYGVKAVRFVMGDNSSLKYGARLVHSFLGDNSTISCCEVLNNLVFPAHEQHHNNSFLIASLVMGQSNIGAGATIGSNHNSRAPDGEMHAGRGFWPGLCVNLKHNSRFASFTLLAKGSYPAELDLPLPFCLVSNDPAGDRLQLLPAYWWMYNMYALARNTWKFGARDKRAVKRQNIEFESLAPDTVEEIFSALDLLALWTARADLLANNARGKDASLLDKKGPEQLVAAGHELLSGPAERVDKLEILAENVECSARKVVVLKAHPAYAAYRRMLHYYAMKNLLDYCRDHPDATRESMCEALGGQGASRRGEWRRGPQRDTEWVNLGGQLVRSGDLEKIRSDIKTGRIDDWDAIHSAYDRLWEDYPTDKQRHALATLVDLLGKKGADQLTDSLDILSKELWNAALDEAVEIQNEIAEQTYLTRKKDLSPSSAKGNRFRRIVYGSDEEMAAVLGSAEDLLTDNDFVKQVYRESEQFAELVEEVRKRG